MIATLNLNGDYLSDALAAEVGGMGIASGCQPVSDTVAMFEATPVPRRSMLRLDKVTQVRSSSLPR